MEDKNYSKLLEGIQKEDFCPILDLHFRLLAKSKYDMDKKFVAVFDEIDNPTEKERAEIREINARTDSTYINSGVVSPQEIRDVLRADDKSGYTALAEEIEGEIFDPDEDEDGGSSNEYVPFNVKDEWITVHPNGKENKGRPLFVEEGENYEQAIKRKYGKKEETKKSTGSASEIVLSKEDFAEKYPKLASNAKKNKHARYVGYEKNKDGSFSKIINPYYSEKASEKKLQKAERNEALKAEASEWVKNHPDFNPHEEFIKRQKSYHPAKFAYEKDSFSMDREPDDWITLESGTKVPIFKGKNKKQAIKSFFAKKKREQNSEQENNEKLDEDLKYSYEKQKEMLDEIYMSESEFLTICHKINDVYEKKYKNKKIIFHNEYNIVYKANNKGFNNYEFNDKMTTEEYKNKINDWKNHDYK